jgi:hypothetical protein
MNKHLASNICITLSLILGLIFSPATAFAQLIFDPGSTSAPIQAESCAHASRGLFGGECTIDCKHACDLPGNRAQAWMRLENLDVGERYIVQTIYSEFTVSSATSNQGNLVPSTLDYNVEWLGNWNVSSALLDFNASTTITLWMTDRTSGQTVINETLHTLDAESWGSLEIVDVGAGRDVGESIGASHINLIRGHTYRVHLTIRIDSWATSTGFVQMDYYDAPNLPANGQGVWWNELAVTIGQDQTERIDLLEERVETLEELIEDLSNDFNSHTHDYKTGRGKGHNKVKVESSQPIVDQ